MLVFGPVSSVFDFLTFYALLHLFGAGEALFQTGWFIESMATQVLVVFAIRTRRQFFRSRPHWFLVAMALGAVARRDCPSFAPARTVVRFRRAAAAVLRLPGGRDRCISGARRNHQEDVLPLRRCALNGLPSGDPREQLPGMSGDLLVFLRGKDPHRANVEPGQAIADLGAHLLVIFADAAGEDDQVDAVERGDHRGHLLAHRIAEHLDGQPGIGV